MSTLLFTNLRSLLAAAVLATVVFASSGRAQNASAQVRVRIPFAFESGDAHLPAGTYTIMVQPSHYVLLVHGYPKSAFAMAQPEDERHMTDQGKVIFRRHGSRYFLRDVWVSGTSTHYQCIQTRAERQLVVARADTPTDGTEVALLELPR
jgi:hypothetical protein